MIENHIVVGADKEWEKMHETDESEIDEQIKDLEEHIEEFKVDLEEEPQEPEKERIRSAIRLLEKEITELRVYYGR